MFKNINTGLIASRGTFLTDRNRLLYTRLITNSTGDQFYSSVTGYIYHVFKQPGSFDVHTRGSVDVMLVGGGGGGGGISHTLDSNVSEGSGGGGAGGVKFYYNKGMPVGTYEVIVGTGGAAGQPGATTGYEESSSNLDGRGGRGGYTHIYHTNPSVYPQYGNLPSSTPDAEAYQMEDGTITRTGTTFFKEWCTRHANVPNRDYDDYYLKSIPQNIGYSYCLRAWGGGGGGYCLHEPPYGYPSTSQSTIPLAYYGGGGGSAGGGGNQFNSDVAVGSEPGLRTDGARERSLYEPPEGNIGGSGYKPHNSGPGGNGGGGGGGAGGAGQPGNNTPGSGQGGIGVAAFNGDTGIPAQYGTVGPPASPGTRWFGGGGMGGDNGTPISTDMDEAGWYGGGGLATRGDSSYAQSGYYGRDGKANTGGGGSGARTYTPYNTENIEGAGAGGSGIVMIRYQASL